MAHMLGAGAKLVNGHGKPLAAVLPPADRLTEIERAIWTLQQSVISQQRMLDAILLELGLASGIEHPDTPSEPPRAP